MVVALIVVGLAVAREARSFGLLGVLGPVLGVVIVLVIVRAVAPAWIGPRRSAAAAPPPRDVTPRKPAISAGASIAPRAGQPPVVIVDPGAEATIGTLEAKLATLDRLHDDGRLTDAEYEAKRAQLIADF